MANKLVYFFGNGKAEGNADMRAELGGKGANLAEMTNIGVPVPPGFTISTDVCKMFYDNNRKYPEGLKDTVAKNLAKLEKAFGKKLGDPNDPLLVSVRSGAAVSMPGMMDTILNLGLNDKSVEGLAKKTSNPRFAWDAYRRFIQMFGDVAMGVPHDEFEAILDSVKAKGGKKLDTELGTEELQTVVAEYKKLYKKYVGTDFPQDPVKQMWHAIDAVFGSWMNERAIKYRELNNIKKLKGTAVTVMAMVFGNMGNDSGTGVCFSRNASTGENKFYGEYLINAQGEDVVAGIRTPKDMSELAKDNPKIYDELVKIRNRLEKHYRDMQDMEFTIQQGKLYMLQCRNGKRTGAAAIKMAVDMVAEKLITKEMAINRVEPQHIDQLLHPTFNKAELAKGVKIASGLNASPGAACGQIVFTAADAEAWAKNGKKVLLVRKETSPDDIAGMVAAQGILTATGGRTSHAAVVARGMGTPCVCGCEAIKILDAKTISVDGKKYKEGDYLSIDGSTGTVYEGQIATQPATLSKELETFLGWCDEIRNNSIRTPSVGAKIKGFGVRANGDQPVDAENAFKFGAEGIGLCRTEHMFFDPAKLPYFQAMIGADTKEMRQVALKSILPLQQKDFVGIFKAMKGHPVIIRFLDPPLHEFTPKTSSDLNKVVDVLKSQGAKIDAATLKAKFDALHEQNPMMGHRGCRLAITYPEILEMQTEAVVLAAIECQKAGVKCQPNIMIPIVGEPNELSTIRSECEAVIARVQKEKGVKTAINIGTMIEIPRAAILSDKIVKSADFYSFGTNDLTQMTFGYSRDDAAKFLDAYYERNILEDDPFKTLDKEGVGALIKMAVEKARSVKPDFHCGICGEHGGDPDSIKFCYEAGINYVSCSPFRVPVARLAAAQAVLASKAATKPVAKKAPAKKSTTTAKTATKATAEKKAPAKKAATTTKPAAKKAPAKKTTKK